MINSVYNFKKIVLNSNMIILDMEPTNNMICRKRRRCSVKLPLVTERELIRVLRTTHWNSLSQEIIQSENKNRFKNEQARVQTKNYIWSGFNFFSPL